MIESESHEFTNITTVEEMPEKPYTLQMTILMIILVIMLLMSIISVTAMTIMLLRILIQPLYDGVVGYFKPFDSEDPMPGTFSLKGGRVKQLGKNRVYDGQDHGHSSRYVNRSSMMTNGHEKLMANVQTEDYPYNLHEKYANSKNTCSMNFLNGNSDRIEIVTSKHRLI